MLYFKLKDNKVVGIESVHRNGEDWVTRWDYTSFLQAQHIASSATVFSNTNYIAIDNGENVSPRYDVIKCPSIGDKVSKRFNSDSYPDGEIVSISKSLKVIVTSTGSKYYRKRLTAVWLKSKTWGMVSGHHSEKNLSH